MAVLEWSDDDVGIGVSEAELEATPVPTVGRSEPATPGAFVSKVFNGIPPKEIEKFSNLFRAEADKPSFRFEVVKGDRIRDIYYYESVASESGSLGISCMKHEHCQKYFGVYTQNTDKYTDSSLESRNFGIF